VGDSKYGFECCCGQQRALKWQEGGILRLASAKNYILAGSGFNVATLASFV
jgi:hypothetical protein